MSIVPCTKLSLIELNSFPNFPQIRKLVKRGEEEAAGFFHNKEGKFRNMGTFQSIGPNHVRVGFPDGTEGKESTRQ